MLTLRDHTQLDTLHSVVLLWTSDRPVVVTSSRQHTTLTTARHPCLCRIRTRNPSKPAAADPRFTARGHRFGEITVAFKTDQNTFLTTVLCEKYGTVH